MRAHRPPRDEGDVARRMTGVALFVAITAAMQPPFLFGSLADALDLPGGQALSRSLVSAFFVATAVAAVAGRLEACVSRRTVIAVGPLLAAASLAALAVAPGPGVAAATLAVGGVVNGVVTRAAIRTVNQMPRAAVPGGLAELAVAAISAPLFVGLGVALCGAAGLEARATFGAQAVLVATAGLLSARASRYLPATSAMAPGDHNEALARLGRTSHGWRLITICAFAAATASYVLAIFFVPFVRDAGVGVTAAGVALVLTSAVAAITRLWISRHPEVIGPRSRHTSTLILAGAAGTALLAVGLPALLPVALPLIGAGAWGWIGLLLSATRHARDPVAAGAAIQGCNFAAAALSPLVAGLGVTLIGSMMLLLALAALAAVSAVALWRPLSRLDAVAA